MHCYSKILKIKHKTEHNNFFSAQAATRTQLTDHYESHFNSQSSKIKCTTEHQNFPIKIKCTTEHQNHPIKKEQNSRTLLAHNQLIGDS